MQVNKLIKFSLLMNAIKNYALINHIAKSTHSSFLSLLLASGGKYDILRDTEEVIKLIPKLEFRKIVEQFENADPYPGYSKYLEAAPHIARAIVNAKKLNLDKQHALNILDIGSGAAYFPFVCNFYGHKAMAMDLDSNQMYNQLKKLLNVSCKTHRIEAFQSLPEMDQKFDLTTGFQTLFDQPNDIPWGRKEWTFFLDDISKNLKPNGKLYIGLNTFKPEKTSILKDNLDFFKSLGAKVQGQDVYFANLP